MVNPACIDGSCLRWRTEQPFADPTALGLAPWCRAFRADRGGSVSPAASVQTTSGGRDLGTRGTAEPPSCAALQFWLCCSDEENGRRKSGRSYSFW